MQEASEIQTVIVPSFTTNGEIQWKIPRSVWDILKAMPRSEREAAMELMSTMLTVCADSICVELRLATRDGTSLLGQMPQIMKTLVDIQRERVDHVAAK